MRRPSLWIRRVAPWIVPWVVAGLSLVADPRADEPDGPPCAEPQCVPALVNQFLALPGAGGMPAAFSYWQGSGSFIGDNPTHCQHYQGIARMDAGGVPYFFLTRSGNQTKSCCGKGYWPGELLTVKMGSQTDLDGEHLGMTCAAWPPPGRYMWRQATTRQQCVPAQDDVSAQSVHFNGAKFPPWMHLGGVQLVDDILVLPLEEECPCYRDNGECGVPRDGKCKLPSWAGHVDGECNLFAINPWTHYGALAFVDVSEPTKPFLLREIRGFNLPPPLCARFPCPMDFPGTGVVGVTRNPWEDNYLFIVGGADYNGENDYYFLVSNSSDLRDPDLELTIIDIWSKDDVRRGACQKDPWRDWQALNFLQDAASRTLYLIGADNTTTAPDGGEDWARLFRVDATDLGFVITCVAEKHFYSDFVSWGGLTYTEFDMGDMDALGAPYVSPSGRLSYYTGLHDNDWDYVLYGWTDPLCDEGDDKRCHAYQFGEFTSLYFRPPAFDSALWPRVVEEGQPELFDLGSFTDPLHSPPFWVDVNWGDGVTDEPFRLEASGSIPPQGHAYGDGPATYDARVRVRNSEGFAAIEIFAVDVTNVPPELADFVVATAKNDAARVALAHFCSHFSDRGAADFLQMVEIVELPAEGTLWLRGQPLVVNQQIDPGCCPPNDAACTGTPDGITVEPPPGWTGTVRFRWNGSDGAEFASEPSTVILAIFDAGGPYGSDEGAWVALQSSLVGAPPASPLDAAWSYAVVSADPGATCAFDDASVAGPGFRCTDEGEYKVTMTVSGAVDGPVNSFSAVTVRNVAPTASVDGIRVEAVALARPEPGEQRAARSRRDGERAQHRLSDRFRHRRLFGVDTPVALVGLELVLEGSLADPGVLDTHSATVDWGDGVVSTGTVVEPVPDPPGSDGMSGTVTAGHVYDDVGLYTVRLTVSDDDGGSAVATAAVRVVAPAGGVTAIADALQDLADSLPPGSASRRALVRALADLIGNAQGTASNGAAQALLKQNEVSALIKIASAIKHLSKAETADPSLDLSYEKGTLALVARAAALHMTTEAAAVARRQNDRQRVRTARSEIAAGDARLTAADHAGAVEHYLAAIRAVQAIGR